MVGKTLPKLKDATKTVPAFGQRVDLNWNRLTKVRVNQQHDGMVMTEGFPTKWGV